MSHKIRNKLYLPNVADMDVEDMEFEGKEVEDGLLVTAGTSVTKVDGIGLINKVRLSVSALSIATTDATTSGAYGSHQLCTLPDTHLLFLGAAANLSFTEAHANITATAGLKYAVGTVAEAANDTLDSTSANIIPSTAATLSSSAAANVMGESTASLFVDASGGSQGLFLNLGIPDAGSSGDGAIVVTGYIDLFYLDIGNNA